LWRHAQQQHYLEGPWSRASVPLALLAAQIVSATNGRRLAPWWAGLVAGAGALLVGASGVAVVLSVWALTTRWRAGMRGPDWVIAAVVVLWVVMAPVYHPYFRLLMPFTLATYIMAANALAAGGAAVPGARPPMLSLAVAGVATAVTAVIALRLPDSSNPWRPEPGLAHAAAVLDRSLPPGVPVRVMGEPALAFHLHQRGHPAFKRTYLDSLDDGTDPVYLVTGMYLRRAPRPRASFNERKERMEPLARVPLGAPSDIRVLDDFRPDSARRWMQQRDSTYDLLLFRYTPARALKR
jgi:hypothetical protein